MSTIQQFDQLVTIAEKLGYRIRYDYFGGTGGGVCEFSGTKWLFLDLALTCGEQLEQLQKTLANEPLLSTLTLDDSIRDALSKRGA
jgi:hypothetical protein